MPRQLINLLLLLLPICSTSAAGLQFSSTDQTVKATAQDKELHARYPFANSGAETIWIVEITTSCGCTKATADKTQYQPGENGAITATYNIGLSQGRHTHTISVQTSDPATPSHTLKITADLPTATTPLAPSGTTSLSANPRELSWTREPYATKTIALSYNHSQPVKVSAACDSDRFELRLDDSVRPALLHVTPRAGTGAARAEITLTATPENAPPSTLKIPLALISLKGLREK